jgi:glycosyltransferase involved in cell wall biosynthesis
VAHHLDSRPTGGLPPALDGLRLLAFCDYYSPQSCGGAERVAHEVYLRLARWGAEVSLVTALPAGWVPYEAPPGMRVVAVPALDLSGLVGAQVSVAPSLFRGLGRMIEKIGPQVLHANGLHFQGSVAVALSRFGPRPPLVTTAHVGPPDHLPGPVRLATKAYERSVGRLVLGRSRRAIAVSQAVAEHLATLGVPDDQITVVPNGVDHRIFRPGGSAEPTHGQLIVYVGRLIANKGPLVLLQALKKIANDNSWRAQFVGEGPLRSKLERTVAESGLRGRVEIVGRVDDVAARLRQATVLVRPTQTEGMSLAVLEAMASRVCVVASNVAGNAGLLCHGRNALLFPAADASALAGRLIEVLHDSCLRDRLANRAYEEALSYSWERTAAETAKVLVDVAGGDAGQRR